MSDTKTVQSAILSVVKSYLSTLRQEHPALAKAIITIVAAVLALGGSYFGGLFDNLLSTNTTSDTTVETETAATPSATK